MDPAMMNDGGGGNGIYNFAEIWNGFQMTAAATMTPYSLDSDPMLLDQGSTRAPTIQNPKKRLEEDDMAKGGGASTSNSNSNNNAMSEDDNDDVNDNGNDNGNDSKRLKAVGSNVNREKRSIRQGNSVERPKQDFIHVRARRGQATDSHSLAERARREKISERMKALQDLVPGCNRVIGKALVLDEIINYIQSLQRQVEFLSMKLEAVNSRVGIDGYPSKDFGQRPFDDASTVAFGTQSTRDFGRGSSPEWLHMQIGGGFARRSYK